MFRSMIAVLSALLIGWSAFPATAQAQMACGERKEAVASLQKDYSEAPVAIGLTANGNVVEVFTSESGTFTIIVTKPSGISCLMLSGESWEDLPARLADAKS